MARPKQRLMIGREPGVRAALAESVEDAGVDGRIAQIVAGLAVDIKRDRHAPCALARDHPVGPSFHHGQDAVLRRSEEHTSELQSLMRISYAVFCLKKKKTRTTNRHSNKQY